ncbi:MAG: DUF3365 domain-containing protein [Cocleimonas sp.]|nr:DUF3365 domain-containing protein [Cocleimonas sp.]
MKKQKNIRQQFNIVLISLYLLSLVTLLPLVYYLSSQEVYSNANKELSLLVDMVSSMRKTVSKNIRPELLRQEIFHPAPALSSTVFTRHTAEYFKKLQPSYYIKVASDNPLNLKNSPLPLEQAILDHFRNNRDQKKLIREGIINGKNFLMSAAPSVSKANCNICHSTPEAAPPQIVQKYGRKHGYGYKIGTVVGASFVGVPIDDIANLAFKRGLTITAVLTLLFTSVLIIINLLVKRKILNPLEEISRSTKALSQGDMSHPIEVKSNDELGELGHSIELLRRSLEKMMKR